MPHADASALNVILPRIYRISLRVSVAMNEARYHELTMISSSLCPLGPVASRVLSRAKVGKSNNSRTSRTDSIATRRSKGWDRNLGSIKGGSFGSLDRRLTSPAAWLPMKAMTYARYVSGSLMLKLGICYKSFFNFSLQKDLSGFG